MADRDAGDKPFAVLGYPQLIREPDVVPYKNEVRDIGISRNDAFLNGTRERVPG